MTTQRGFVHIYTGNGKGKTTAAIGISVRARGSGMRVLFSQFFKESSPDGEIPMLKSIGIETLVFDNVKSPLFNPGIDKSVLAQEVRRALTEISGLWNSSHFDLVVLDEFICLINEGVLTEEDALDFLKSRPDGQEVIITGNGTREALTDYADYVTNMQNIKHPFTNSRMDARKGIEY